MFQFRSASAANDGCLRALLQLHASGEAQPTPSTDPHPSEPTVRVDGNRGGGADSPNY